MPAKTEARGAEINISPEEIQRRVAVLRRFRELLTQQRERFARYLEVLDKQKDIIESGSADDLISHVELEEKIVSDICAIQKVIDPLESMYHSLGRKARPDSGATGAGAIAKEEKELPGLKAALEELRAEAVIRSARNRDMLAKRMEEIRQEMKALRANPYAAPRSVFSGAPPSLVDIHG